MEHASIKKYIHTWEDDVLSATLLIKCYGNTPNKNLYSFVLITLFHEVTHRFRIWHSTNPIRQNSNSREQICTPVYHFNKCSNICV